MIFYCLKSRQNLINTEAVDVIAGFIEKICWDYVPDHGS